MSDEDAEQLQEGLRRAGRAVAEARGSMKPKRLTQKELAARAGIDVSTLREIERGVVPKRGRHLATMSALSDALGWEPDRLRRIAAGEETPWQAEGDRTAELTAQVEALTEQVTTLLADLNRLAAQVDRLSRRVHRLDSQGG